MPGLIYILCALTSLGIAILLLRPSKAGRDGLRLWTSLCFFALAANNALLYINFIVLPDVNLLMAARVISAAGIVLLNIGLIWHAT